MTAPHPATLDVDSLLKQCTVARHKASGPGGQHRNKVETAVTITHTPTGITGSASERRSQSQNQSKALFRLRVNLALQVRRGVDPMQPPSMLWQSRCKAGKVAINPAHDDFPAILAELLDTLAALDFDPRKSAAALDCTSSQVVRLLKLAPAALVLVNDARMTRNLKPLC